MRIPEALSGLATAVILPEQALTRIRKQSMMLAVAAAYRNVYCGAWHHRSLRLRSGTNSWPGYATRGLSEEFTTTQ